MTDLISEPQLLPVRRHRDADRQVDVHRDAGDLSSDHPPDRRAQRRRSPAAEPSGARNAGARLPKPRPGGSERRAAARSRRLRQRADERDLLAGEDPGERRQRRAGARHRHRQGPRDARSPPSRTRSSRCSSPPRSAPRRPKRSRASSRPRSNNVAASHNPHSRLTHRAHGLIARRLSPVGVDPVRSTCSCTSSPSRATPRSPAASTRRRRAR